MCSVIVLRALGDNLISLCPYGADKVFVVDPADAAPVRREIDRTGRQLTHILVTHHHWDHTGGVAELKKATGCAVVGPGAFWR